jgi:hypothetical protein
VDRDALARKSPFITAGTKPRFLKLWYEIGVVPVVEKTNVSSFASSGFMVTSMSTMPGAIGTVPPAALVFGSVSVPSRLHEWRTWIVASRRSMSCQRSASASDTRIPVRTSRRISGV